jgi:hypothetical protein
LARGRRLSPSLRIALIAGLVALAGLLAVGGRPFDAPMRRLANYRADPPGPIWNTPIDDAAIAKAAAFIPRDGVYALVDGSAAEAGFSRSTLHHDLAGAAFLHLLPAVPAVHLRDAEWAIVYDQPVPERRVIATHRLGSHVTLVRLRTP